MMLSLLIFLLAVFPVVSTESPIFGPKEVSAVEGSSVSIMCYYPSTSVNRHTRKYWCRQGAKGSCMTLISSGGYISEDYLGRSNLTNFPALGAFMVNIAHLSREDSGHYKCGLGNSNRGLNFDVSLEVSKDPRLLNNTDVYTMDMGRTVTIKCPFSDKNAAKKKSLCKKTDQSCELVINSNGDISPSFQGRVRLVIQGTSQDTFTVIINQLRTDDAGMYVCQAGEDPSSDQRNVDLQVLEPEPELVYGQLRGSVTFDCALGPEVAKLPKFLCRVNKNKPCDVIINTLGKRDPAFEGRILLSPKDPDNGRFSVLLTGLQTEDAGEYLCGAHSDGEPQQGWPLQAWQLFVNPETIIPRTRTVVKGVTGGSVAVLCPYDPKDSNSFKYWCRWEGEQSGRCPLLVESQGKVQEEYEGRLALYEEPGDGFYTVILNQLTTQDAGFYWCLTNDDTRWRTMVEIKVADGEPSLKVPKNKTAVLGEPLKLHCHFPCKYYSYEKFWCKWSNQGCQALPSQDEGPSQASVSCQSTQLVSMTLQSVTKEDEGWYWCGMKQDRSFGETAAVYVAVEEKAKGSDAVNPPTANSAPEEEVVQPRGREVENNAVLNPRLFAEERVVEDTGNQASGSRASVDTSSSEGQSGSSKVLLSTLVPLGLVLALGTVAVWVARARHRKNVDRLSIRSYRTDISMSDFENSRDYGGNDNMGASPVTQETVLEGKVEVMANTESTMDAEEPRKAKRSSKEEADMAYSAFLLQSSNIAAQAQDGPKDA